MRGWSIEGRGELWAQIDHLEDDRSAPRRLPTAPPACTIVERAPDKVTFADLGVGDWFRISGDPVTVGLVKVRDTQYAKDEYRGAIASPERWAEVDPDTEVEPPEEK